MSYGKIDPWKAGAVFAVIVMPVAAMAYNAMHAFPVSKTTIILFAVITILCAILIEFKTSEKDSFLRQTGIIILFALAIVSVGGLSLHGALGRDLSLASEAETEYAKKKKAYEDRLDKLHEQELEDKSQNTEDARLDLEREKLRLSQNIERRRQGLAPLPEPKRDKKKTTGNESQTNLTAPVPPETQTDVIKRYAPYNFWAQFVDMLLSVAGLAFIMAIRQWDANSDGCPDWIEREAKIIPEKEFAKRHPEWYEKFYPKGTSLALGGNSTVNAESPRRIGFNPSASLPPKTEVENSLDVARKTSFDDTEKTHLKIPQVSPPKNDPHADAVLAKSKEYKKEYNKEWIDEDLEDTEGGGEGDNDDQKWARIKGARIPIIKGTRWKSHKKRGYVECWLTSPPEEGKSSYLGMINKKILLKAKTLSDEQSLKYFTSLIDQWKRKRENPKSKSPLTPEEN